MSQNSIGTPGQDALAGIEAMLDVLDGDPFAALAKLADKMDPGSVKRRLAILINSDHIADAVAEVRRHEMSETWIDLAIFVLAATGAADDASTRLEWAQVNSKLPISHRCAIGYSDGTLKWAFRNRRKDTSIVPGSLNEDETQNLRRVAEVLDMASLPILAKKSTDTELEAQVLMRLLDVSYLLESRDKANRAVAALLMRKPVPIKAAQAVVQEIAEPTADILDRLWSEHGESFKPRFLACLIQARTLRDISGAKKRALALTGLARSSDDKDELSQLLYELSGDEETGNNPELLEAAAELIGPQSSLMAQFRADTFLRENNVAAALDIINSAGDQSDPKWMRLNAIAALKDGRPIEALTLMRSMADVAPDPDLFRLMSDVARNNKREADEIYALERWLHLSPGAHVARRRIAWLYAQRDDYENAASQLEVLHAQLPSDTEVTVNLAICYGFSGLHDKALAVLVGKGVDTNDFAIVKARVQIFQSQGRFQEAFNVVQDVRERYWDDPQFVSIFMTVCHAADREKEAHQALTRMIELKEKGLVDDKTMHTVSLDNLKEMMSGVAKRDEAIKRFVLEGKLPWLLAAEAERESPYWAWQLRTQSLAWLYDHPLNRVTFSIYATNGFRVLHNRDAEAALTRIECPPIKTEVIADLSALITLHSLGILEKAADYFGTIAIPARYRRQHMADMQKLFPHQLSQKRTAEQLKLAINNKQINVEGPNLGNPALPVLNEYQEAEEAVTSVYRLVDLFESLHDSGCISDAQRDEVNAVAHKPLNTTGEIPPLNLGIRLRIDDLTLGTIAGCGLLDTVIAHFEVYVSQEDSDSIMSRARTYKALSFAQEQQTSLWEIINANIDAPKRFRFVSIAEDLAGTEDQLLDEGIAIAAFQASKQKAMPLLADDRVIQTLLLNEWKENPKGAFGTDCLVPQLAEAGVLTLDEAVDCLLKLIDWRYKFVLFSAKELKHLADRYRSHPPGLALRRVAIYVHDCMRDEGLFAGAEPVTPPVSIAIRMYQSWIQNIAEFMMDIWLDESIKEELALRWTNWAVKEFMPSPPFNLDPRMQSSLASLTPRTAITRALIRSSTAQGGGSSQLNERAYRGLRAMTSDFSLSDAEYLKIVASVVNAN